MLDVSESLRFRNVDVEPIWILNSVCAAHTILHRGDFRFPVHQRRRGSGDLNAKPSTSSGGSWWIPQNGLIRIPGSGTLKVEFPADPLRVYRVSDGKLVAALGSFPGGIYHNELVWSPSGEYIAFQDGRGDIRFWNPLRPDLSVKVARGAEPYSVLLFSKDGSQLAANFADGLKVFDVVPPAK